ncbi:GGDEF domain-containing protein [Bacterioplanes sanyensis]|nr:GGDEF domain-containing protein [Bacterioplanes sanyensis]
MPLSPLPSSFPWYADPRRRLLVLLLALLCSWGLACLALGHNLRWEWQIDAIANLAELVIFTLGMCIAQLSGLSESARRPMVLGFFFTSVSCMGDWVDEFVDYSEPIEILVETVEALFVFGLVFAGIGFRRWLMHQKAMLAQQTERTQHFRLLSELDGLTDVYNRAVFDRELPQQIRLAHEAQCDVALLLIDLDHFKRVNDEHGHSVGDQVLRAFGQLLKTELAEHKLLFRYGGEEFAVLLPAVDLKTAQGLAERVRHSTELLHVHGGHGRPLVLSVSIGIAMAELGEDALQLLQRTDHALYQAKQSGRNRVCCG